MDGKGKIEYRVIADSAEFPSAVDFICLAHDSFRALYGDYGINLGFVDRGWWLGKLDEEWAWAYGAFQDGRQIAGAILEPFYGTRNGHDIAFLYVVPDCRRKGIATGLLRFIFADLREQFGADLGSKSISLNVMENNVAAKALYRKLGLLERPFECWYDLTDAVRKGL